MCGNVLEPGVEDITASALVRTISEYFENYNPREQHDIAQLLFYCCPQEMTQRELNAIVLALKLLKNVPQDDRARVLEELRFRFYTLRKFPTWPHDRSTPLQRMTEFMSKDEEFEDRVTRMKNLWIDLSKVLRALGRKQKRYVAFTLGYAACLRDQQLDSAMLVLDALRHRTTEERHSVVDRLYSVEFHSLRF